MGARHTDLSHRRCRRSKRAAQIHQLSKADADDETGGRSGGNPARDVRGARGQRPRKSGKGDDARRALGGFEPAEDQRLLRSQPLGREMLVGLGHRLAAHVLEPVGQFGETRPTDRTAFEMRMCLSNAARRLVGPDRGQPGVVQVGTEPQSVKNGHGVSSTFVSLARPSTSSVRSLRIARNRCTRTVDSFKPVSALTSRDVHPS